MTRMHFQFGRHHDFRILLFSNLFLTIPLLQVAFLNSSASGSNLLVEVRESAVAVGRAVACPPLAQIPSASSGRAPACGFRAPGSSDSLVVLALHIWSRFPLQAAAACQSLPYMSSPTVSEYCRLI